MTENVWVEIVFMQDAEFAEIEDFSVEEMAEYLARWDCGTETDYAHSREYDDGRYPWGASDRTYDVSVGGIDYVLSVNHHIGYAGLCRRPLA